jgi:hypothetical protein
LRYSRKIPQLLSLRSKCVTCWIYRAIWQLKAQSFKPKDAIVTVGLLRGCLVGGFRLNHRKLAETAGPAHRLYHRSREVMEQGYGRT